MSGARGAGPPTPPHPHPAGPPSDVRSSTLHPQSLANAHPTGPTRAPLRDPPGPATAHPPHPACAPPVSSATHTPCHLCARGPRSLQCKQQPLTYHPALSPTQASTHPRPCHASVHTQAHTYSPHIPALCTNTAPLAVPPPSPTPHMLITDTPPTFPAQRHCNPPTPSEAPTLTHTPGADTPHFPQPGPLPSTHTDPNTYAHLLDSRSPAPRPAPSQIALNSPQHIPSPSHHHPQHLARGL